MFNIDNEKLKSYSTIAALLYAGAYTLYNGIRNYRKEQRDIELVREIRDMSVEVHSISKKKSDLSIEEQIDTINQARMLVDISMYGSKVSGDLERSDIAAEQDGDVKSYLAVKAGSLHRDMHQELRRQKHKLYSQS